MKQALLLAILIILATNGGAQTVYNTPTGYQPKDREIDLNTPAQKWYDFKTYKPFATKKIICYSIALVSGVAHGIGEAYHAEPTIFETRWDASPRSGVGSASGDINGQMSTVKWFPAAG